MLGKILFVDDEEQIRKLVTTYLGRRGYHVRTANNGAEALVAIHDDPPDLVVTDVAMPEIDGLALTQQLRANHRTARMPIIVLSAHKETGDVLAGYGAGADEYVPKPIELAVLGAKIDVLLTRLGGANSDTPAQRGIVSVFMHGKGGVGTTTLAVNTAISIVETTRSRVVLLDLNLGFANAEMLLDLQPARRLDQLAHFDDFRQMEGAAFSEFLTPHLSGLSVLAGPASPEVAEAVTPAMVEFALEKLRREAAQVVVDLPISFSETNLAAIDAADLICVVTSPEIASLKATRDCLRVVEKLRVVSHQRTLVILNRTTAKGLSNDQVADFLHRQVDATVPYDPLFTESADEGRPFVTARRLRPARKVIGELAERIAASRIEK